MLLYILFRYCILINCLVCSYNNTFELGYLPTYIIDTTKKYFSNINSNINIVH